MENKALLTFYQGIEMIFHDRRPTIRTIARRTRDKFHHK